jgi:uncharacterized protein (TIGR02099 family)
MIRRSLLLGLDLLALLLLLLVLTLLALRLLLPEWSGLTAAVEQRVGVLLGREVRVESVRLGWSGWAPELVAREVSISVPDGVPLRARELGVSLAPLRSLRALAPIPGQARLRGVGLRVERDAEGALDVHGWRFGGARSAQLDWARYLAGLDRLQIEDAGLLWIDHLTGVRAGLRVETLGLRSDASGLRVAVRGSLLPEAGGPVRLGLEVPAPGGGRAEFFLEAEDLQIAHWGQMAGLSGELVGNASVRLWGELEQGRLRHAQGEHDTRVFTRRERGLRAEALAHSFQWRRGEAGAVSRWTALAPGAGDARVEYVLSDPDSPGGAGRIELRAAGVDLGRYARIAAAMGHQTLPGDWLTDLEPSGTLESLDLILAGAGGTWRPRQADAVVRNLGLRGRGGIPGFDGIDASLDWRDGHGDLTLEGAGFAVQIPALWENELPVDRLSADLAVSVGESGWRFEARRFYVANEVAAVDGRGSLELGAEPHLDVALRFLRGDGARVDRYFPERKLPPKTYRWLAESIRAGTVTGGGMVFRGNPSEFPFAGHEGVFDLRLAVSDGLLDYRSGWPEARELSGTLIFRNAEFRAEQASGMILDSRVTDAAVHIPNMLRQPVLDIRGQVAGPLDDLADYLRQAGIGARFARYRDEIRPGGDSELELALAIPLHGPGPAETRASGRLRVSGALLELPEVPVTLRQVAGEIRFDPQAGIRGEGIRAVVHGEPVTLDFRRDAATTVTRVLASGRQPFAPWLGEEPLGGRLRGTAHWDLNIRLGDNGDSSLELNSNLEGVEIDWPAPLAKTRGTRRPLQISWPLGERADSIGRIRFDDVLAAEVRVAPGPSSEPGIVQALAVHLGQPLPERLAVPDRGIDLQARLPSVDVGAWMRALASLTEGAGPAAPGGGRLELARADIEVLETLRWQGRSFPGGRVRLESTPEGRRVTLEADWLQGQALQYPGDAPGAAIPGRGHWRVDLERAELGDVTERAPRPADAPAGFFDPRNWPAVDLSVGDLRIGGLQMSGVELALLPLEQGLELANVRLRSPDSGVHMSGSGRWTLAPEGDPLSEFSLGVSGDNWGSGLGSMGISGAMEQGSGTARVHLSWPGPLFAPDLPGLQGRVDVSLSDGRLREVDPGVGRLLGLVSLDLIPRRMRLDFRDVYTQGLSFDRLVGEALIEGGDLLLPELQVRSPSAVVRISGRTGLVARDFDQSIVVVPRLRSTLPIVGALVGGPVTGAIVLLVERALGIGGQVEEAARVEYFVTGPWSNPEVRARVRTEEAAFD